jgi:pyruvate/2-oxoglutarate dehydrogenase complex dihydrolipoamide acyltransferase (E2) component
MQEIIMPKLGLQMTAGTIQKWLKREGETVRQGEPILTIESDKSVMDIQSPASGTLLRIVRSDGAEVPVTDVIGYIGSPGEVPPR